MDAANRAVKGGLIEQVDVVRDLKDLRNEIVHEYTVEDFLAPYAEIYEAPPRASTAVGPYPLVFGENVCCPMRSSSALPRHSLKGGR